MLELNNTSPYSYVDSRIETNTYTMGNPMPESTLSPSQGLRIWPHFNSFVRIGSDRSERKLRIVYSRQLLLYKIIYQTLLLGFVLCPMRPKAREMTQHGGPPEEWPSRVDGPCRTSLTDRTACPGLDLLSCEFLANPTAIADVLVLNVHKTPSRAFSHMRGMSQNSS